jgi:ABC-type dipeptide/oligopeptide/nickel transport system ATPase component
VADRVVFMADGRIVEEAPPDEFFANPKNEKTRNFLGQILVSHHAPRDPLREEAAAAARAVASLSGPAM